MLFQCSFNKKYNWLVHSPASFDKPSGRQATQISLGMGNAPQRHMDSEQSKPHQIMVQSWQQNALHYSYTQTKPNLTKPNSSQVRVRDLSPLPTILHPESGGGGEPLPCDSMKCWPKAMNPLGWSHHLGQGLDHTHTPAVLPQPVIKQHLHYN